MKTLLLILSVFFVSAIIAQKTPTDAVFNKYKDKKGVEVSVNTSSTKDTVNNTNITTVIKNMTISNDDEDAATVKMMKKIKKKYNKIFSKKDYKMVHMEKDEDESTRVYVYTKSGVAEMCVLAIEEDELTFTTTQFLGLTDKMMKEIKFDFKKN